MPREMLTAIESARQSFDGPKSRTQMMSYLIGLGIEEYRVRRQAIVAVEEAREARALEMANRLAAITREQVLTLLEQIAA